MPKSISNNHITYDKFHGTSNLMIGLIGPLYMGLDISDPGITWLFCKNTFNNSKFGMGFAHTYSVLV